MLASPIVAADSDFVGEWRLTIDATGVVPYVGQLDIHLNLCSGKMINDLVCLVMRVRDNAIGVNSPDQSRKSKERRFRWIRLL